MPYLRGLPVVLIVSVMLVAGSSADILKFPDRSPSIIELPGKPTRGMSMSDVEQQQGVPSERSGPVGDPPISRWDYDGFSVFFEEDLVLHSVVHAQPQDTVIVEETEIEIQETSQQPEIVEELPGEVDVDTILEEEIPDEDVAYTEEPVPDSATEPQLDADDQSFDDSVIDEHFQEEDDEQAEENMPELDEHATQNLESEDIEEPIPLPDE